MALMTRSLLLTIPSSVVQSTETEHVETATPSLAGKYPCSPGKVQVVLAA
jgi:hypothetical protein